MKFGISQLLVLIALVAVFTASAVSTSVVITRASITFWLLAMTFFVAAAMISSHRKSALFARCVASVTLLYLALPYFVSALSGEMPHAWLAAWLTSNRDDGQVTSEQNGIEEIVYPDGRRESRISASNPFLVVQSMTPYAYPDVTLKRTSLMLNTALAFGLIGGCLSLWLEQRHECREKSSNP